ncbi:MAG TPA: PAS domain S-box protein, partial [Parasegetibacter sp.]
TSSVSLKNSSGFVYPIQFQVIVRPTTKTRTEFCFSGYYSQSNGNRETRIAAFSNGNDHPNNNNHRNIGVQNNQTSLTKYETEIIEREKSRFRALVAGSVDGMLLTDEEGNIDFAIPPVTQILGFEEDELVGTNCFQYVHPDDLDTAVTAFKNEVEKKPEVKYIEIRLKHKDGHWVWCSVRGHNLQDNPDVKAIKVMITDISAQKSAEARLRESEENFKALFENSLDVVKLVDENGIVLKVSPSSKNVSGYEPEEVLGHNVFRYVHPADLKKVKAAFEEVKAQPDSRREMDFRVLQKEERWIWCSVTVKNLLHNPYLKAFILTFRDITSRKQAEADLYESEQRWKFALEGSGEGVWDWNLATNRVYYSDSWKRMFGYEDSDITGFLSEWDMRVHPEERAAVNAAMMSCLEGKTKFYAAEYRIRCKDGSYRWILDRGMITDRDDEGRPIRMIGTHRDLNDRKLAEEALKRSEQRFKGLVQSGGDIIAIINRDGVVTYSSPTALTILGNDPESNIGKNVFEWIHPADAAFAREKFEEMIRNKKKTAVISPYRYPHATNGYRWLETVVTDLTDDPAINGYVINSRDITERRLLEESINSYTKRLETAQKIAKLGYLEFDFKTKTFQGSEQIYELAGIDDLNTEITFPMLESLLQTGDRKRLRKKIRRSLRQGASLNVEYEIKNLRGEQKIVMGMGSLTKDAEGRLQKFNIVIQDVTDFRSAQIALQTSENRFKYLFENSADGIMLTISGGEIQLANPALCEMLGYDEKEILGKRRAEIIDMSDEGMDEALRIRKKEGKFKGEIRFLHKSGRSIETEVTSVLFRDASNRSYHSTIVRDITEKKKQQKELLESKTELQKALNELNKIVENSVDLICSINNEGRFVQVSAASRKIWNYSSQELTGSALFSIVHPEDLEETRKVFENLQSGEPQVIFENRILKNGGGYVFMEWSVYWSAQEQIAFCVARDISAQKEAEERARISENNLRISQRNLSAIFSNTNESFVLLDKNFRVKTFNNKAVEYLRRFMDKELKEGINYSEALLPVRKGIFEMRMRKVLAGQELTYDIDYDQDEKHYFQVVAKPIYDETNTEVEEICLTITDVTEQKNAAKQIKDTADQLTYIMESISDGMVILDRDWTITYVNIAAEKILGMERYQMVGHNYWELFPETVQTSLYTNFRKVMFEEKAMHFEEYIETRSFWLDFSVYPIGEGVTVYFRDITEKKKAEEEIRLSNERYNFVSKATNEAIWDWNLQSDEIYLGERFELLFGYNDNFRKVNVSYKEEKIHPLDRERVLNGLREFAGSAQATRWEDEYRFLKADGTYAFVMDKGYLMLDNEGKPLRMIGSMQDVTLKKEFERKLLYEEMNKQKLIVQAAIDAQERERALIGKELHDNINQILTTTKLYLELSKTDEVNRLNLITRSANNIAETINEIRKLSRSLVPPSIGDLGLVDSIVDLVENVRLSSIININFKPVNIQEQLIEDNMKLMLYRIIQEQVSNVIKHAHAKNLNIDLIFEKQFIRLVITDDGKGFDLNKVKRGLGISNMISRTNLFNGNIKFLTSPGKGCKLIMQVPINQKQTSNVD